MVSAATRVRPCTAPGSARTVPIVLAAIAAAACVITIAAWALGGAKVEGDTPEDRIASICRLADKRPRGACQAIAAAAEDGEPEVRAAAMLALGRFEDGRSVVEAGIADKDPSVRVAAAGALGTCGGDDAIDRLARLAFEDPDGRVRLAAVVGLGRIEAGAAALRLADIMERSDDYRVRSGALEALEERFGIRFGGPPDPRDPAAWSRTVGLVRLIPAMRDYEAGVARTPGS